MPQFPMLIRALQENRSDIFVLDVPMIYAFLGQCAMRHLALYEVMNHIAH